MIEAELPNGTILEFPDGTDPAVIQRTVKRQLGIAEDDLAQGPTLEELRASMPVLPLEGGPEAPRQVQTGFGVTTPTAGLAETENIAQRSDFVPLGVTEGGEVVVTPSKAMQTALEDASLPKRIVEGHVPTQDELINFALAILPMRQAGATTLGRRTRSQRVPAAARETAETAAQETAEAAQRARQGVDEVAIGLADDAAESAATEARAARFRDLDIPATRGDLTQDFADQTREARLLQTTASDQAEPIRQFRLQQSQAFADRTNELVDSLGVSDDAGQSLKAALQGRFDLLDTQRKALYKEVAEAAPEVANTPLITDDIVLAIPNKQTEISVRRSSSGAVDAINEALVEFGLDASEEGVEAFTKKGGEVTPLTLGNFDEFRKELNRIVRAAPAEQRSNISRMTGPIMRSLDEEAAFIDDAIKESGITDEGIVKTLNEARSRVTTLKTEFSPKAIRGRLIGLKDDGESAVVEASQAVNELFRRGAPVENLERVVRSLDQSGRLGKAAIGDLQASAVMQAMENALKATSRKTGGTKTISGNAFAKALDTLGDAKLDALFKGNPEALQRLRDLRQTGLDFTPTAGAVPKGSAAVNLDIFASLFNFPGGRQLQKVIENVAGGTSTTSDVRAALDTATPAVRETVRQIRLQYPNFAARVGLITGGTRQERPLRLEDLEDTA